MDLNLSKGYLKLLKNTLLNKFDLKMLRALKEKQENNRPYKMTKARMKRINIAKDKIGNQLSLDIYKKKFNDLDEDQKSKVLDLTTQVMEHKIVTGI